VSVEREPSPPASSLGQKLRLALLALLVVAVIAVRPLTGVFAPAPAGVHVVLWHSQRGREREVLEALLRDFNTAHAGQIAVEPLAVPEASFKDKVRRSIPHGAGPDLFIRPHNEIGELAASNVLAHLDGADLPTDRSDYLKGLVDGVSIDGAIVGVPLTYKGLLQFYNTRLLPEGPLRSTKDLAALRARLPEKTYPLAYDATSLYFQSPFFLGSGGSVFDASGKAFRLFEPPGRASFDWPGDWKRAGILPPDVSYNEATRLFEAGQAAVLVCGPWYTPQGDVSRAAEWDVAPLFDVDDRPGGSFVSIESVFVSASTRDRKAALEVARWLAGDEAQRARYRALSLPPVWTSLYEKLPSLPADAGPRALRLAAAQRHALEHGMVTPSSTRMGAVWTPALDVLSASVAGRDVGHAIEAARYTLDRVEDDTPRAASPTIYGVLLVALLLFGTMLVVRRVRLDVASPAAQRARLLGSWGSIAVPYVVPGVVTVVALVLVPVIVSAGMSLFEYQGGHFTFVGTTNFREILLPPLARALEARSFYFALGVTVLWTLVNVVLHVAIGVSLALLLRPSYLRFRTVYRLVLILPWAIPNYITALMWKGMFHAQVGAINALLRPFGFEGYNWFDRFGTAFFANVVTNTWLGFPFMMVVTLGALSSIPSELEEAATLDGASRWQRFTAIVLPHIKPALLPSVLLGSVWTFNMFNVVYLVSGGEPGSQTDILVSEAYRWAFERGERYGYAAAYSVLIFLFLLFYGRLTRRLEAKEAT
jgi:arabinogalactan oligomer/maltooligosaccharide transport system permease protein